MRCFDKGVWTSAGWGIKDYLRSKLLLQKLIGWTVENTSGTIGMAKPVPLPHGQTRPETLELADTTGKMAVNFGD